MERAHILVVEDTPSTASLISHVLKEKNLGVKLVSSLKNARSEFLKTIFDLLILDRGLPDGEGLDFVKEIRSSTHAPAIPILILTAQNETPERVAGLNQGADDYLGKPFNTQELSARVDSLLRRAGYKIDVMEITCGGLHLNFTARKASFSGKDISLSEKEFDLLWFLAEQKNRALSREIILQKVWGYDEGLSLTTKVVDVTVSHLKEKLGKAADRISPIRGIGYRFED